MSKNLHTGNYAITVHTFAETVDTEFSEEDKKAGLINSHAYSLKNVTDSEVTVINPLTQKEITISREKFMESFYYLCTGQIRVMFVSLNKIK